MMKTALPPTTVTVRPALPGDATALVRIAQLDSAPVPRGATLLGLVDGRIVAAMSVETGAVIADPFVHTADLVTMLRARGEGVLRHEAQRGAALGPSLHRLARGGWLRAA